MKYAFSIRTHLTQAELALNNYDVDGHTFPINVQSNISMSPNNAHSDIVQSGKHKFNQIQTLYTVANSRNVHTPLVP